METSWFREECLSHWAGWLATESSNHPWKHESDLDVTSTLPKPRPSYQFFEREERPLSLRDVMVSSWREDVREILTIGLIRKLVHYLSRSFMIWSSFDEGAWDNLGHIFLRFCVATVSVPIDIACAMHNHHLKHGYSYASPEADRWIARSLRGVGVLFATRVRDCHVDRL